MNAFMQSPRETVWIIHAGGSDCQTLDNGDCTVCNLKLHANHNLEYEYCILIWSDTHAV